MSGLGTVQLGKCPIGGTFHSGKCPVGELSSRRNVRSGNYLVGEMSGLGTVQYATIELFSDYGHLCGFILVTYREYLESATLRTSNDGVLDDFKLFAWRKLQAFKAALGPKPQSKGTTDFNEYGSRLDEKEPRLRGYEHQEMLGVDREDLTSSVGSSTLARTEADFESMMLCLEDYIEHRDDIVMVDTIAEFEGGEKEELKNDNKEN